MIDVPKNLKEIIDDALSPFMNELNKLNQDKPKSKEELAKELENNDGVSDEVKAWLKDKQENPWSGKPLNEAARVGISPEELKKMRTL